ncbi:hypothetical protein [uncultured Desulfobulbus sp.]|uniref:hypothetical protein n=1 Tax=uncultured Desulfobulbus sp. TaxID=239745 RepID=UPI0029C8E9DE|nr:hypothetical protein [uncultured Desulfobulbus sp.]
MTIAVTSTGGQGMTATAKVDMAAGMTGVDTGIMKMVTVTGFMRRRQASIHRLQSRASGSFFPRSILIPEWRLAALVQGKEQQKKRSQNSFPFSNPGPDRGKGAGGFKIKAASAGDRPAMTERAPSPNVSR